MQGNSSRSGMRFMLIVCQKEQFPCPVQYQAHASAATVDDFAQLGITAESISIAIVFGFGVVFFFAMLGFSAGKAIEIIRKL